MFDIYTQQRKIALQEMAQLVDSVEFDPYRVAREEAIRALGSRYLLHPTNKVQRRVKPYGSVK